VLLRKVWEFHYTLSKKSHAFHRLIASFSLTFLEAYVYKLYGIAWWKRNGRISYSIDDYTYDLISRWAYARQDSSNSISRRDFLLVFIICQGLLVPCLASLWFFRLRTMMIITAFFRGSVSLVLFFPLVSSFSSQARSLQKKNVLLLCCLNSIQQQQS
jgi:hypothetical protein